MARCLTKSEVRSQKSVGVVSYGMLLITRTTRTEVIFVTGI
ncbi:hypothetical protein [Okeania sp. KiyG1]|nr:hypothetical protein [Okeania sp. KiyG1]